MPTFFIEHSVPADEDTIRITGADRRHMKDVLRMKSGEDVQINDSAGWRYDCRLQSYGDADAVLKILGRFPGDTDPRYEITVYQGLPKSDKMDSIIQKCTELGASRIVPVVCARSVVRFRDEGDAGRKIQRWAKIAKEAAKQSGRNRIPVVDGPLSLGEAAAEAAMADVRFLAWECEDGRTVRQVLRDDEGRTVHEVRSVAFLIGPEGGFDAAEVETARKAGLLTATLGKRILRTETAAPAVLAMLMYEFEMA